MLRVVLTSVVALMSAVASADAQPQPAPEPSFRLIRSVSGTRGSQQGSRFEVEDPRTVFTLPADRQIVVYFEWDGPVGRHECEARWKDPSGKVVLVAPTDYQAASRRFGIRWSLALADGVATGLWAVETYINGEPAGTHVLEIRGATSSAPSLSAGDIYQRALAAVATVECVGDSAEPERSGIATAADPDHMLVTFRTIEACTALRLRLPGAKTVETREVGARNRKEGWAVIRALGHGLPGLPRAPGARVGQRVFLLDALDDGSRVIAEASIVGRSAFASGRPSFLLNSAFAHGAPILDERAQWLGIAVPSHQPIIGPAGMSFRLPGESRYLRDAVVLTVDLIPTDTGTGLATLAELAAQGLFVKPLTSDSRHVISGVFAAKIERRGDLPWPIDQRSAYSRREANVSIFVQWNPQQKREVSGSFVVFDLENRPLVKSPPTKLKLKANELFFTTWTCPLQTLEPGTYRIDLLLDDGPIWRGWLKVTE